MILTKKAWQNALVQRHGRERQDRFSAATVAICGLGGLGSNIAIALARAGIGKLILIDFDSVDITNLHRQQYKFSQIAMQKTEALAENLHEINPYVELKLHTVRITEENAVPLLQDADIICEAVSYTHLMGFHENDIPVCTGHSGVVSDKLFNVFSMASVSF